jgi:hypothetical protein
MQGVLFGWLAHLSKRDTRARSQVPVVWCGSAFKFAKEMSVIAFLG